MTDDKTFQEITDYLFSLIPKEELERHRDDMMELCPEFAGFVDTYYYLSKIIPKDYTVIDFGAAYNAQSYFFTEHKKYMAVNPLSPHKEENGMFCPKNCEIFRMTTKEFIETVDYPKEKVFAICNYVPNWYHDSIALVHENFRNCYTFFPEHQTETL